MPVEGELELQHQDPPTETSSTTRGRGKEEGSTQTVTKNGGRETASNDTKTAKDEAARILEGFLLQTWDESSAAPSVLVIGEASWVIESAVWVRKCALS